MEDDDDVPQLSAATLAALQQFYTEKQVQESQDIEDATSMPSEDWQLSQFWYEDDTSEKLAKEAIAVAGEHGKIVCLSSPSVYKKLKELNPVVDSITLLEYDKRFAKYGQDFIFYDYNEPCRLPSNLQGQVDIVVADPPFLTDVCLEKVKQSIEFMAKDKIILCTGAIMEDSAKSLLGVTPCGFLPKHSNKLSNTFFCYTNFKPSLLLND
ncbi:EEF1A lysine methyltransferase 1-like isoform X2 [Tubulanus polymorphus]